jgi:ubiquinone/menaquinone biosynthesis C-methylase UbiE
MATDYVLGNDQEELARLKLQHDLWKSELVKLWQKSKIKEARKILDLGCGPGFTSMDLLNYIGHECQMTSVDISEGFLNYLKSKSDQLPAGQKLTTHKSFIEQLDLPSKDYEAAFCRWLMIFVQDPEKAIRQIHAHLKPQAQFILQEYVSYDSMDLVPDFKHMRPVVDAVFKSWRDQGGDPNRGKKLPFWLEKVGFKVVDIQPVAKFSFPNEPLWAWPDSFYKSFLPRLEKTGYLTAKQVTDFFQEWEAAQKTPGAYFVAPTVISIIAEKR